MFGNLPEDYGNGVHIIRYDSKANEIVRSKIILQHHLFSLLVEGHKTVHTLHNQLQINESQFLLLTAGHYLMTEKTTSPQGDYQSILLFFTQEALTAFFAKYPGLLAGAAASVSTFPVQPFTKDDFLTGFIQSLSTMLANDHTIPAALQQLKLEELLLYLCHKFPQQVHSLQALATPADETEAAFRKLVESNRENNVTLEELAFLGYMSLSTFKRKFHKIYGIAPSKWFLQKRMEHAAALLLVGKEKPSDVCYKIGYESHSSFTYSFRQVFGVTPSEYVYTRQL